ncbi:hypothetical protein D3C72_1312820 [compost metagenome]
MSSATGVPRASEVPCGTRQRAEKPSVSSTSAPRYSPGPSGTSCAGTEGRRKVSSTARCGVNSGSASKPAGGACFGVRRGSLPMSHPITLPMIGTHSTISSVAMSRVVVPGAA